MSLAPYTELTTEAEVVCKKFRFQVQAPGGANPDFQVPAGAVKNVVRNSAGVYTVTLPDGFRPPVMLGLTGTVIEAVPAHDLVVKASLADFTASAGTFKVTIVGADGTTAAEDPADNDWVYLEVAFCRRTQVGSTTGPIPA